MLSASDASQRTKDALASDTELLAPYIQLIENKIRSATEDGKNSITHPFSGLKHPTKYPTDNIKTAVRKAVESAGYKWINCSDPDPGYSGSGPYIEITW
jgi:hypothetical protein